MGLWILEPKSNEPVPGTVHLQEHLRRAQDTAQLKHGTGRNADIVLIPQPSDSPNDPLNWSTSKKWYLSIVLSIGAGLMVGTNNFVNPANGAMAKFFHTDLSTISRSVSVILLTVSLGAAISSPAARIWGKRPTMLLGTFVAAIGYAIVIARPHSLIALYVGRAVYGLGASCLEYLVSSTVGDLFFVHERGVHLAVWHYALSGGNAIGQIVGSQIVEAQDWVWAFRYAVIVMFVYTIGLFFTCPETTYNRDRALEIDIKGDSLADDASTNTATEKPNVVNAEHSGDQGIPASEDPTTRRRQQDPESASAAPEEEEAPITYLQSLRVYNGRFSSESYARSLLAPWVTYLLPSVLWSAFAYGGAVAFAVTFSVTLGQIFTEPPYNFTTAQVGLTVLSALVGVTLGNAIAGPASDWSVRALSARNSGVYEPEFRIALAVPAFVLGVGGFWGFGTSLQGGAHWMVPVFFYGLATLASACMALIPNMYLLDAHRAHSQDVYAAVTVARGLISFVFTFIVNDWIDRDGYAVVYYWIGALHGLGCVLGMVLYVYGKRIRLAVAKNEFIQNRLNASC